MLSGDAVDVYDDPSPDGYRAHVFVAGMDRHDDPVLVLQAQHLQGTLPRVEEPRVWDAVAGINGELLVAIQPSRAR